MRIATPEGEAQADLSLPDGVAPRGAVVLGHGAGGGVGAPDLQSTRTAALAHGWAVALVTQPYRLAGRRAPVPAPRLDRGWESVVATLAAGELSGLALVCGGRSSGARVACRTAAATGAVGVLCLAFPLAPPPRRGSQRVAPSRLPELDEVAVPVLVVQGERDRFGIPPARTTAPRRELALVAGDHALRSDSDALRGAVGAWLDALDAV